MASSKNSRSTDFLVRFQERLTRHVTPGQRVCVALSGGIDSVVLLHAMATLIDALKLASLVAVHVNHGLSPNADQWEAFCRQLCERLRVRYESRTVAIRPQGGGIEAAARMARYAELEACECDWVLLGHHRDDQAETVLFNLLRGTGVRGAAGMTEMRGRLLRPLLDFSRDQIAAYAQQNELSWVEDDSNADSRYRRNFLRNEVIPLLEQTFPQARYSLSRAAQAFANASELLDQRASEDLGTSRLLPVDLLKALPTLRAENLLAFYLRRHGLQIPSSAMLRELLRQLLTAACDSEICFAVGGHEVRRYRDQVIVDLPLRPILPTAWRTEKETPWGSYRILSRPVVGDGISAAAVVRGGLILSPRKGGDALQLRPDGPRRSLKDLLREAGIPPWRRKSLPVLYAGDEVVWVAGIGIDAKYRCKPGAEGFLIEFDGVTW